MGPLCALRKDKIFIIFSEDDDRWLVVPGHKAVCPGQTVTWQVFGRPNTARVDVKITLDATVFETEHPTLENGQAVAKVRDKAALGNYPYTVVCDGRPGFGGSHPSVIIDWGR
ncbi:MAG: hypothetical protein ACRD5G_13560 [Candidatus Acidiferrales bacterium]